MPQKSEIGLHSLRSFRPIKTNFCSIITATDKLAVDPGPGRPLSQSQGTVRYGHTLHPSFSTLLQNSCTERLLIRLKSTYSLSKEKGLGGRVHQASVTVAERLNFPAQEC